MNGAIVADGLRFSRSGGFGLEVDLDIASGERVALMGASGSGKSTLLDLVSGFETPQAGHIRIGGRDVTGLAPAERPVSLLFQDSNLFPHLDAFTNVALGLDPGLRLSHQDEARARAALARVGLAGKEERRPAALSGGERQRVAIARTLVRRKPVLLLDEPFGSLGPALTADLIGLTLDLAAEHGLTAILVTHDPDEARAFAARLVFLEDGKVAADGPTRLVLSMTDGPVARYLGARPAR